ncbi:MAG: hypothetical protein C6Y20_02690 [Tagaea sp. CACIAM 22H2]|nr:hypothetical protein [Tagaea sp. CACIAM 22H2]
MLSRFVSSFAVTAFALWTLLCLGFWGVIALGGDLLRWFAGILGGDDIARSVLGFLEAFGTFLLAWVWLAGAALIAFAGFTLRRAARHATTIRVQTVQFGERGDWGPREMKDVTPPKGDAPDIDLDQKRLPPR